MAARRLRSLIEKLLYWREELVAWYCRRRGIARAWACPTCCRRTLVKAQPTLALVGAKPGRRSRSNAPHVLRCVICGAQVIGRLRP